MIGWNIGRTATLFIPGYGTKSLPSGGLSMNIGINIGYPVYIFELSSNISTTVGNLVIECSHSTTPGSGTKVFDYKQNINYCGAVMFTKKHPASCCRSQDSCSTDAGQCVCYKRRITVDLLNIRGQKSPRPVSSHLTYILTIMRQHRTAGESSSAELSLFSCMEILHGM